MPEYELGVPIPGRVLPRDQWTHCGYRDDGGPFPWRPGARRVVDLGCGNGRYLISSALARPDCDHLGIDLVQRAIDFGSHRAGKRGLGNVRFAVGDAVRWLFERLEAIDEIHVYHPQPYYEESDIGRRMLTPEFFERLWVVCKDLLVLQTDNKAYWTYIRAAVQKHFDPTIVSKPWPDSPRTRREILARQKGLAIWRLTARRRKTPRAVEIPRPDFDANRPRFR